MKTSTAVAIATFGALVVLVVVLRASWWLHARHSVAAVLPPLEPGSITATTATASVEESIDIYIKITNAARMHEWQMSQPARHHADIVIDFEGQKVEMTFPQFKAAVFNRACWDAHQE